jgi:hypothetical protein
MSYYGLWFWFVCGFAFGDEVEEVEEVAAEVESFDEAEEESEEDDDDDDEAAADRLPSSEEVDEFDEDDMVELKKNRKKKKKRKKRKEKKVAAAPGTAPPSGGGGGGGGKELTIGFTYKDRLVLKSGDTYSGWLNEDKKPLRHGGGICTYKANGDVYNGGWKNDRRFGFGTLIRKNGEK